MSAHMSSDHDRQWYIVGRWQEYEGEGRANLLRILAIGAFYGVQLLQFYRFTDPTPEVVAFHRAATFLAVAWVLMALAVLLCLRGRVFPASLKFITTAGDIVLLTALAMLANKANSPLVLIYFLVIAVAALRFSLRLIWFTKLASFVAYLALVGASDSVWFDADHTVPPVQQLLTLLSLGLCGVLMGQLVRRTRALAEEFSQRIAAAARKPS